MEWSQILAAVQESLAGDRERGRRDLLACWDAVGAGEGAQRCVLAHYLADLEPLLDDEVTWDERALAAYALVGDADLAPIGIPAAAGMAPSLHLNLGDGYLRQGRLGAARAQLEAGLAATGALGQDGYGELVRQGLRRLQDRIDAATA